MQRSSSRSLDRSHLSATISSLLLAGGVLFAGAAFAQTKPDTKLDPQLGNLLDTAAQEAPPSFGNLVSKPMPTRIRDGKVLIDASAVSNGAALAADLTALGAENVTQFGKTVSAWLPTDAIGQLGNLKSLQFARPSYAATNVGSTTSQGDPAMYSDWARSWYGVNGSGIKVGVLSDSFDNTFLPGPDYAGDVATGDLPPDVEILKEFFFQGIDEGRAMAQLIYDVAPRADLSFHTAFEGLADFAVGIEELGGCPAGSSPGCGTTPGGASATPADVIVDDIIYFFEPMFQDGVIAQAADTVAAAGIPYFSSNGNNERLSYEGGFNRGPWVSSPAFSNIAPPDAEFIPSCFDPDFVFGVAHDFDPGPGVDIFQDITLNPGEGFGGPVIFQWDEPFASVSGAPGSTSDHDFYLVITEDPAAPPGVLPCVLFSSVADNIGGDPVEGLGGVGLPGGAASSVKVAIMIVKFADIGPDAGLMKWVSFGGNRPDEYDTFSGTGYGHANAAGAEGVGAAFYQQTPRFGTYPAQIEPFSSAGGVPILFDTAGNRLLTPEVRLKPGITAPDGTNTTFFGFDVEGDGFPNFFGTSAAAPHAAAVAALMLDAYPDLTSTEVYQILRSTALDMDDPATPFYDAGFDFGTGAGLINARRAVAEAEKRKWLGGGGFFPWY